MIEPTDEMIDAFDDAAMPDCRLEEDDTRRGLAAVLAIVERDYCLQPRGHVWNPLTQPSPTCTATVETKGVTVRCGKRPDGHDTHLARHDGWDVIW